VAGGDDTQAPPTWPDPADDPGHLLVEPLNEALQVLVRKARAHPKGQDRRQRMHAAANYLKALQRLAAPLDSQDWKAAAADAAKQADRLRKENSDITKKYAGTIHGWKAEERKIREAKFVDLARSSRTYPQAIAALMKDINTRAREKSRRETGRGTLLNQYPKRRFDKIRKQFEKNRIDCKFTDSGVNFLLHHSLRQLRPPNQP